MAQRAGFTPPFGPGIARDGGNPERESYRNVLLTLRLRAPQRDKARRRIPMSAVHRSPRHGVVNTQDSMLVGLNIRIVIPHRLAPCMAHGISLY